MWCGQETNVLCSKNQIIVSYSDDLQREKEHIRKVLHVNGYFNWGIDRSDQPIFSIFLLRTCLQSYEIRIHTPPWWVSDNTIHVDHATFSKQRWRLIQLVLTNILQDRIWGSGSRTSTTHPSNEDDPNTI